MKSCIDETACAKLVLSTVLDVVTINQSLSSLFSINIGKRASIINCSNYTKVDVAFIILCEYFRDNDALYGCSKGEHR